MAGLKGKGGPPGNMNAFKHGLAAIQKRLEEGVRPNMKRPAGSELLGGLNTRPRAGCCRSWAPIRRPVILRSIIVLSIVSS
jgi:hypothetical protein